MGGSHSTNKATAISNFATKILTSNILNCSTNANAVQRTIVSGNYNVLNGISQVFTVKLSAGCFQDASTMLDLQTKITNAISQQAKAQSVTLTGALGKSDSDVETLIKSNVQTYVNSKSITNLIQSVNLQQELVVSGNHNIIKNFSQNLTSDLIFKGGQKLINKVINKTAGKNVVKTKSIALQKSFFAGLIKALGSAINNIINSIFGGMNKGLLIIVIGGLIGAYLFRDVIAAFFGISSEPDASQSTTNYAPIPRYVQPQQQYRPPPQQQYRPPPQQYAPPPSAPPQQYRPPQQQYRPPLQQYAPPPSAPPQQQYRPPQQYAPPPSAPPQQY